MAYNAEEIDAPSFHFEQDRATGTRRVRVTGNIDDFINDGLFGTPIVLGSLAISTLPSVWPGRDYLWVKSLDLKMLDTTDDQDADGVAQPCSWDATINYETPDFDGNSQSPNFQPLVTQSISSSSQILTHSKQALEWQNQLAGANQLQDGVSVGFPATNVDHRIDIKAAQNVPFGALFAALGKTNSAVLWTHPIETLLFRTLSASRSFSIQGPEQWKLGLAFSARVVAPGAANIAAAGQIAGAPDSIGWNHFMNPDDGKFDRIRYKDQTYLFPTFNFGAWFS